MRIKRTIFDWHFLPACPKNQNTTKKQKVATHPVWLGRRSQGKAPLLVSEWVEADNDKTTHCLHCSHTCETSAECSALTLADSVALADNKKLTQNSLTNERTKRIRCDDDDDDEETRARLASAAVSRCELVKAVATVKRERLFIFETDFVCVCGSYTCIQCVCVCKWQTHSISKQTANLTKRYIVWYIYKINY